MSFVVLVMVMPGPSGPVRANVKKFGISMLSRLRVCLDGSGILDSKQISEVSPREDRTKSSLPYTLLSPENSAVFCRDAAETIARNVLLSCSQPDSGFYLFDLRSCFDSIEKLAGSGTLLSALALSALVHMSKCTDADLVNGFISIATKTTQESYRNANPAEHPSGDILAEARKLVSTSPLAVSLLRGFDDLTTEDIQDIRIEFVYLKDKFLRGWCAPGTVVLNIFALKQSLCLSCPGPLAVIIGHESRHVLERKVRGDMNFSTPDKNDISLHPKNRESGLGFELNAIGEKFSFDLDPDDDPEEGDFLRDLVEAIGQGLASNKVPALDRAQLIRFRQRRAPRNLEMALEYQLQPAAYYFTE